jgi:hypothetical protein
VGLLLNLDDADVDLLMIWLQDRHVVRTCEETPENDPL